MNYNSEMTPPRVFTVVTSSKVTYNIDFVEYLIQQEQQRRLENNVPKLSTREAAEFRRQLISKVVIHNDADAAINLRPTSTRMILQEKQ